jgi:hypothetical protein
LVNVTKDGGNSWQKIGDFPGFWVSMVQPSSFSESRVYLSLNAYREEVSVNAISQSPTELLEGLEKIGVLWALQKIFSVGNDNGLYISLDQRLCCQ